MSNERNNLAVTLHAKAFYYEMDTYLLVKVTDQEAMQLVYQTKVNNKVADQTAQMQSDQHLCGSH